ncbi:MAG: hypothetical protein JKY51_09935 [Opitutaceae bacterium]|nr:hypothetical protein [Opitutaceae bacterium]
MPIITFKVVGNFQFEQPESFSLIEIQSDQKSFPLLQQSPGLRWKNVNAFVPTSTYIISAYSSAKKNGIAFTEPVEMGLYSWLTNKFLKKWPVFLFSGLVLFLFWLKLEILTPSRSDT